MSSTNNNDNVKSILERLSANATFPAHPAPKLGQPKPRPRHDDVIVVLDGGAVESREVGMKLNLWSDYFRDGYRNDFRRFEIPNMTLQEWKLLKYVTTKHTVGRINQENVMWVIAQCHFFGWKAGFGMCDEFLCSEILLDEYVTHSNKSKKPKSRFDFHDGVRCISVGLDDKVAVLVDEREKLFSVFYVSWMYELHTKSKDLALKALESLLKDMPFFLTKENVDVLLTVLRAKASVKEKRGEMWKLWDVMKPILPDGDLDYPWLFDDPEFANQIVMRINFLRSILDHHKTREEIMTSRHKDAHKWAKIYDKYAEEVRAQEMVRVPEFGRVQMKVGQYCVWDDPYQRKPSERSPYDIKVWRDKFVPPSDFSETSRKKAPPCGLPPVARFLAAVPRPGSPLEDADEHADARVDSPPPSSPAHDKPESPTDDITDLLAMESPASSSSADDKSVYSPAPSLADSQLAHADQDEEAEDDEYSPHVPKKVWFGAPLDENEDDKSLFSPHVPKKMSFDCPAPSSQAVQGDTEDLVGTPPPEPTRGLTIEEVFLRLGVDLTASAPSTPLDENEDDESLESPHVLNKMSFVSPPPAFQASESEGRNYVPLRTPHPMRYSGTPYRTGHRVSTQGVISPHPLWDPRIYVARTPPITRTLASAASTPTPLKDDDPF